MKGNSDKRRKQNPKLHGNKYGFGPYSSLAENIKYIISENEVEPQSLYSKHIWKIFEEFSLEEFTKFLCVNDIISEEGEVKIETAYKAVSDIYFESIEFKDLNKLRILGVSKEIGNTEMPLGFPTEIFVKIMGNVPIEYNTPQQIEDETE